MAGFQERVRTSLQVRLSLTLSVAILVVAVVAGAFSFMTAFDEANELQDDVLRQVAALVDRQGLPASGERLDSRPADGDEESRVLVQRLGTVALDRRPVDAGGPLLLPDSLADGLQTQTVDGEKFRVLVRTRPTGERFVVAQESGFRDQIARDGALRTVLPFLVLVPILLVITADLVRKVFRPVTALAAEIDRRQRADPHPVDLTPLPIEVRPFAVAINGLLGRVRDSMAAQRRFVADAAHELRSPMTALSLQAERLADADLEEVAASRLADLRRGIDRSRALLEQMLALAKAQSEPQGTPATVSLVRVMKDVLQDLMPLVDAKAIDIGVSAADDVIVPVSELEATLIVRNLVDNAIRYTPAGGRVDIAIEQREGEVVFVVRDSGAGLSPDEIQRVFDPFYRVPGSGQPGSGLGLTIVKAVVERQGLDLLVSSAATDAFSGVSIEVHFAASHQDSPLQNSHSEEKP